MPLDELARLYADELFAQKQKVIRAEQEKKNFAVYRHHVQQKSLDSDNYVADLGKVCVETVRLLADAKVESLLTARERAGIPFDDSGLGEIVEEMTYFCAAQQREEIAALGRRVDQIYGTSSHCRGLPVQGIERGLAAIIKDLASKLRLRRYENALDERKKQKIYGAALGKKWDVFISHASEDKKEFVRPLAEALIKSGLSVWYDESTLKVGDSLRRTIDQGLVQSRFGVVVLSHSFFQKNGPSRSWMVSSLKR